MQVQTELLQHLDKQVKAMHNLLRQLDPETRVEYIKEMLPVLLSFNHKAPTSAQQKLSEKLQSPIQSLSKEELQLIDDLAAKTQDLYNVMNNGGYFG